MSAQADGPERQSRRPHRRADLIQFPSRHIQPCQFRISLVDTHLDIVKTGILCRLQLLRPGQRARHCLLIESQQIFPIHKDSSKIA